LFGLGAVKGEKKRAQVEKLKCIFKAETMQAKASMEEAGLHAVSADKPLKHYNKE